MMGSENCPGCGGILLGILPNGKNGATAKCPHCNRSITITARESSVTLDDGKDPQERRRDAALAEYAKGNDPTMINDDHYYLHQRPTERKKMDLLWLDEPMYNAINERLREFRSITITTGTEGQLRDYDVTIDDLQEIEGTSRYLDVGLALQMEGKFYDAIRVFKQGLERMPGSDLLLMNIGVSYAQIDQKALSLAYLERARRTSPDNGRILHNLIMAKEKYEKSFFSTKGLVSRKEFFLRSFAISLLVFGLFVLISFTYKTQEQLALVLSLGMFGLFYLALAQLIKRMRDLRGHTNVFTLCFDIYVKIGKIDKKI